MPVITILESPLGPAVTTSGDGRLLDLCDDAAAPIGFSCRSARCCTCRVDVLAGAEHLDPPGDDERAVLRLHNAAARHRLACQAVVKPGPGVVQIRWIGPRPID